MGKQKIYVKLFGGEKDGYPQTIEVPKGTRPDFFYVHRNVDDKRINDAEKADPRHHMMLVSNLAVLAYKFHSTKPKAGVTGGVQYRYDRCESADKKLADPAV